MQAEIPKQYDPAGIEAGVYRRWLEERAFAATPDERARRYVVMMPLPNVTGALHMGHAMDNVMQDLLTRWHRMQGDNTLWQPGTDHAGIATQAIVEKRLFELEGKTRNDIGREALVERIWEWKEQFQARIIRQQQVMGCGCDWERQRFTMDAVCARAVRWTFFRMFAEGLIYRGFRLVNWDCHLRTAVADDEVVAESVEGHFWHLRYPVIDPKPGEPDHVIVATTRPETMLGDTAVACHPEPRQALEAVLAQTKERLAAANAKDRPALEEELARLEARVASHLPQLETLAAMAERGTLIELPLLGRKIPLIRDAWAKPELGSGCVKITPAHDPNDYEVWQRHQEEIDILNLLEPDGSYNSVAGPYEGLDRFEVRKRVVADLDAKGLLEKIEDRKIEIGHSDRSKTPVEPYLSEQWFVHMGDVEGGIVCGRGTPREFEAKGLAQAAIDAAEPGWTSPSGRNLTFHPDPVRYGNTYRNWLAEKRDWCISRQLWWGHRIPVWRAAVEPGPGGSLEKAISTLGKALEREDVVARVRRSDGSSERLRPGQDLPADLEAPLELQLCPRDEVAQAAVSAEIEAIGLEQDPDVLDTWFSSGLWPLSTLGWPDPATAAIEDGQTKLGQDGEAPDSLSYFYPGSCLVTGRDIITLWVARMQLMGLYLEGDVPFTDCFIHATILDGKGTRMSKSKGNGIDPADIIEEYGADAMRYVIAEMQTGLQDIRLPVQAISPFTEKPVDLAKAKHGRSAFSYLCPETGKEFDVLGTMDDLPSARLVSDRFEVGRNFCNKLWNAARFALLNLEDVKFEPRSYAELPAEDRWILSRLARAIARVDRELSVYNPSAAIAAAREFFWSELCDWYVELLKPRMRDEAEAPLARQVLATVLDQILRLLHPFIPFVTETLWERLGEQAPARGIEAELEVTPLLTAAPWPAFRNDWEDEALEARFTHLQEVVRAVREIRAKYNVPPSARVPCAVRGEGSSAKVLEDLGALFQHAAGLESFEISPSVERAKDAAVQVVGDLQIFIAGVVDLEKEKARLEKQRDQLEKRIGGAQKKLSNEKFLAKAQPEVVARERERLGELERELEGVAASLSELGS